MQDNLKKSTTFITISSSIFIFSAYITNIWLGRYLGPFEYGLYGIVISIMSIANLIQTMGIPQAVSKYVSENENKKEIIFRYGLILQTLATLIITTTYFLLSPYIAIILNSPDLLPYLKLSALILPSYGLYSLYNGYFNGLNNFKHQAILNILYAIFKLLAVVYLSYTFRLPGALWGFIIAPFITLLLVFQWPRKHSQTFDYKKLILFSTPLIGFAIFSTLQQTIDLYFIKSLIQSKNDPGFYTAAQNIARIVYFGLSSFSIVIFPTISKSLSESNLMRAKDAIHKSLRYILILLVPGTLLISATSNQLLQLLYSKTYETAAQPLSVLVIGFAFMTVFNLFANILNGANLPIKSLVISLLGILITSALCLVLIPKYELLGAAIATTVGSFLIMIAGAINVYNRFNRLISILSVARIIGASVVIYSVASIIKLPTLALPMLYIFLFVLYFMILYLIREISKNEVRNLLISQPLKNIYERFR